MKTTINNLGLINIINLEVQIKDLINELSHEPDNNQQSYTLGKINALKSVQKSLKSAITLASKSYEAGKLDKVFRDQFDDPKGRFLNNEIEL